jgi:DNA polymerase/3'-5' exonuclease PolX
LRLTDYTRRLLCLAQTVHRWLSALSALDQGRRIRIAGYAEEIAETLARAVNALEKLEALPGDRTALAQALRELGRISGYIETMVGALEHHLDGRKLAGIKRRLEQLRPSEIRQSVILGRKPARIDRLLSAEGYFRAFADGLRT